MAQHDSRAVLTVFIGSPGDVTKEREIAREVADDVNKVIHEIGWEIDLRGWEDTLPGHGRPQALINVDVRASRLFIGLLHTRWGTPTGEYSSGFEEEFEIARQLKNERGQPEIWLFFKRVPAAQLRDPGEQLAKVLAFRKQVEERKEVLFKDVASTSDWKRLLPVLLSKYILGLHESARLKAVVPTEMAAPAGLVGEEAAGGTRSQEEVPQQARETLATVADALHDPKRQVGEFRAGRLHLLSTSLLANYADVKLGVHEINLLYRHRDKLEPAGYERAMLRRTVVAGEYDVVPGWFWFRQNDAAETVRDLYQLAMSAADETARIRAVQLLTRAKVQADYPGVPREALLSRFLEDDSAAARKEKLNYIGAVGSPSEVPALDRATEDPDENVRGRAVEARWLLMARNDPDRVLSEMTEERDAIPGQVLAELRRRSASLQTATLLEATKHPEEAVRAFAIRELDSRGEWNVHRALSFKDETSDVIKGICYRTLLQAGQVVPLDDLSLDVKNYIRPTLLDRLKGQSLEALRQQIDWLSLEGIDAYEAAADQYAPQMLAQVRADLTDQFSRLRQASFAQFRSRYGPEQADAVEKTYKQQLDGFVRTLYTRVALEALFRHGAKGDAAFGRRFLGHEDNRVRRAAIELVSRFGDASDCAPLLKLAKSNWSAKRAAARAAIKLCAGAYSTFHSLIESGDPTLVEVALSELTIESRREFDEATEQLLRHESSAIRMIAVAALQRWWSTEDLEVLLKRYLAKRPYFYNVVCWLDRALYAPAPLRGVFIKELQEPYPSED
ncbi:MAG TPA: HEAT repeat domain-containing protein [Gemmataceae bacterium]|nr:HEAT repeat domain-containing protein [Gemmataceae bacterium]